MSKPYFNINGLTYSNGVLSLNYTAYKLRGGGRVNIGGFANTISFTESRSYGTNLSYTFSVAALGTSSTAVTTEPTAVTWTFGGTAAANGTNIKFSIGGQQLSNATASGPTLSNYINSVVSGFVFTGTAANFTATATTVGNTSSITFNAPVGSGNFYNGYAVTATVTKGASSLTWSSSAASFANGSTTFNVTLTYPKLMAVASETFPVTSKTASNLY